MSNFDMLPYEVQDALEKYAECILCEKTITKQGYLVEADCDWMTVRATAEDLYNFLKVALNNPGLIEEVLKDE